MFFSFVREYMCANIYSFGDLFFAWFLLRKHFSVVSYRAGRSRRVASDCPFPK